MPGKLLLKNILKMKTKSGSLETKNKETRSSLTVQTSAKRAHALRSDTFEETVLSFLYIHFVFFVAFTHAHKTRLELQIRQILCSSR